MWLIFNLWFIVVGFLQPMNNAYSVVNKTNGDYRTEELRGGPNDGGGGGIDEIRGGPNDGGGGGIDEIR